MQEPQRLNLYKVIQKGLAVANRKTFIHRMIYAASYGLSKQKEWMEMLETVTKPENDDKWDESLDGLGLFSTDYAIVILEGSERMIGKHLNLLSRLLEKQKQPFINFKILTVVYHIDKRFFLGWVGATVNPPVLVNKIEKTMEPKIHTDLLKGCILKLHKIAQHLNNHLGMDYRRETANLTTSCKQLIPESALLEFLLVSPLLISVEDFLNYPKLMFLDLESQEHVWPAPSDFVPYNIVSQNFQNSNYQ